jgi:DNA repair exonuclease SbcCD ATPase subunit
VTRDERLDMIDRLQREADEGRERIRQRQEQCEHDPVAAAHDLAQMMDAEPVGRPPVSENDEPEVIYKDFTNAPLDPTPEPAAMPPPGVTPEAIAEGIGEVAFELRRELRAEISELRRRLDARDERDRTVAERSGRIAELQRENAVARRQAERAQLDKALDEYGTRLGRLETELGMLLKFIGADLPRGWGNDG